MKRQKRKMITERIDFDLYDLSDTLGKVRDKIDNLIEQHGENAIIDVTIGGYDSYDDSELVVERLETNKEMESRLAREEKMKEHAKEEKARKVEKEKKELARLLKKYGKGN